MRYIFYMLIVLTYFQRSKQQDQNNNTINAGASSSRENPRGRNHAIEKCEVRRYADRVLLLLISEDSNNADLKGVMENQFKELEAFYDEVFSYITMARFGAQYISDDVRSRSRLNTFRFHLTFKLRQTVVDACTGHFRQDLVQNYDSLRNFILVRESVSYQPNDSCLCGNFRERSVLSSPFSIPSLVRADSLLLLQVNENRLKPRVEISIYHIIPLTLISRFFETWLSDETTNVSAGFNGCVNTLFGRLKRSMRKLLLVSIKKSSTVIPNKIITNVHSNHFFSEIVQRTHGMLSSNVFLGPTNRGPFSPQFQRHGEELLSAFDTGIQPIIGSDRYRTFLELFNYLHEYVEKLGDMTLLVRLLRGLNIFLELQLALHQFSVIPFNARQWELRPPTEVELMTVSKELRSELRNQSFWAIKKLYHRPRRDNNKIDTRPSPKEKVEENLKNQWKKFVLDLFDIFLNASSRNEELEWSCNFTRMYNDYSFSKSNPANVNQDDEACLSFDEFLYSKISSLKEWHACSYYEDVNRNVEWCTAWNRITLYLDIFSDYDSRKIYSQDVEKFMRWLSSKVIIDDKKKDDLVVFPYDPFLPPKSEVSLLDETLCYLHSISTAFLTTQHCFQVFEQ